MASAPSLAERRLTTPETGAFTSVRSMRTRSSCRSASRLLRSASATLSAFLAAASWACAVFIAVSRCSMVETAITPLPSLCARSKSSLANLQLRLRLRDQALRLVDRRIGAFGRRVVLGHERVELGAIETGEHLALLHAIAVLGVDLDDRQPVDAGRDLRFLARDQGSGDEQPIDEFAFDGGRDGHRRRLDRRAADPRRPRPAPGRTRPWPGRSSS